MSDPKSPHPYAPPNQPYPKPPPNQGYQGPPVMAPHPQYTAPPPRPSKPTGCLKGCLAVLRRCLSSDEYDPSDISNY